MFSFLKGNPLWAGLGALIIIALIIAVVASCERQERGEELNLVNQGVTQERDASKSEVINNVKESQDAVRNPTSDELNVVCSKYDRNCPDSQ